MQLSVGKYAVTPQKSVAGTKGSYGFEEMSFSFDKFWDPLCKKIVFEYGKEARRVAVWLEEGKPLVLPREVTAEAGACRFSIVGYKDDKIVITLAGELLVLDTLPPDGDEPMAPTPDLCAQLMERLRTLEREQHTLWQSLYEMQAHVYRIREQRKSLSRARQNAEKGEAELTSPEASDGAEEAHTG